MTGKTTRKDKENETDEEELPSQDDNVKFHGRTTPHEYYDTNVLLPFQTNRGGHPLMNYLGNLLR
jgi:hypothetical protein